MFRNYLIIQWLIIASTGFSQKIKVDTTDLTFNGSRINPYQQEFDSTGKLTLSGYIDTYYAYYTDTADVSGYQKFPTTAPRNNQFGLNILQVSAKYQADRFRGVATVFFGDCPQSYWSKHLNFIQEANAGFRIIGKLWLDAGFFRTHFGLESIQPRENITTSASTVNYFEPYFLSGAKLTWQHSDKLILQANIFNGFDYFLEKNSNKAIGFSTVYSPSSNWSYAFNTIFCDESPDGFPVNQLRNYNNLIVTYKSTRLTVGMEANFGWQKNSKLTDSTANALIFSGLLSAKYRLTPKWAVYGRAEFFTDPNQVFTGPVQSENNQFVGLDILGFTTGIEYKPIPNAYLRIEGRYLQTKKTERIFYYNGNSMNHRNELIVSLGVWF